MVYAIIKALTAKVVGDVVEELLSIKIAGTKYSYKIRTLDPLSSRNFYWDGFHITYQAIDEKSGAKISQTYNNEYSVNLVKNSNANFACQAYTVFWGALSDYPGVNYWSA